MDVMEWLMSGDPAIRWQVLRDLEDASPAVVDAARAHVEHEGWAPRLLAYADPDGTWDGGSCWPSEQRMEPEDRAHQPWTPTMHSLQTLQLLGLDPASGTAHDLVVKVAANARWDYDGAPYFDGEVEPCINGRVVATGAYFEIDTASVVARLLEDQLGDGGWNCEAEKGSTVSSFDTTINVLEGLLAYEGATGPNDDLERARQAAEEYLLERSLLRRRSTGEIVSEQYLDLAFPYYWHYDVLRALDYFRVADAPRDPRLAEAIDLVRTRRQPDDTWLLDRVHPGRVYFQMERAGRPSRWTTLRALRVLRWWDG